MLAKLEKQSRHKGKKGTAALKKLFALRHLLAPGRGLVLSTVCGQNRVSAGVASRANMLYLAARTQHRVCLYTYNAAHIAASRAFWTDWLPTGTAHGTEATF